ncbi:unnamed protein product [Rhizophagus irregularis]|nr:unnamed protein product [Rhizophagus irregularis]
MMNRCAIEALDRTLRDIMKALNPNLEGKPFESKVVLFGGDFRQILPVAKHVNVMKLKINMLLFNATNNSDTAEQAEFAKWLLEVGEGRVPAISKTEKAFEYLRSDTVEEADDQYPQEFLNSLTSGLPPHKLVFRALQKHDIEVEIITGDHPETRVFIPRIMMSPSETDIPFIFKRRSICNDHK